jgi:hypothetical protein
MRMRIIAIGCVIPTLVNSQNLPQFDDLDYEVVSIIDGTTVHAKSGNFDFLCRLATRSAYLRMDDCVPIIGVSAAREYQNRVTEAGEIFDEALVSVLRASECIAEIPLDTNDISALAESLGDTSNNLYFAYDAIDSYFEASVDRLFKAGTVSYLDNRQRVELKDCP